MDGYRALELVCDCKDHYTQLRMVGVNEIEAISATVDFADTFWGENAKDVVVKHMNEIFLEKGLNDGQG